MSSFSFGFQFENHGANSYESEPTVLTTADNIPYSSDNCSIIPLCEDTTCRHIQIDIGGTILAKVIPPETNSESDIIPGVYEGNFRSILLFIATAEISINF